MTTLHLGDCQSDCVTCENNFHEGKSSCALCGWLIEYSGEEEN